MRIKGETVTVRLRSFGQIDGLGNGAVVYSEPIEVDNVLVSKGTHAEYVEAGGIYSDQSDIAFCFPRGYTADLRGALITRDGTTYEVVGDPSELTDANIPPAIEWNIRAGARRYG